jgi:hypothetical protein
MAIMAYGIEMSKAISENQSSMRKYRARRAWRTRCAAYKQQYKNGINGNGGGNGMKIISAMASAWQ